MSVISSLRVLLTADASQFRRSLAETGQIIRRFEKEYESRFKGLGDKFGKLGGTGFGGFRDIESQKSQFISTADAMTQYADRINDFNARVEAMRSAIIAANAPLNANAVVTLSAARSMETYAATTANAATHSAKLPVPIKQTTAAIATLSSRSTQSISKINLMSAALRYFNIINYDTRAAIQSWNALDVLAGPGRLITLLDKLAFSIRGTLAPSRELAFAITSFVVPSLVAFGNFLQEFGRDVASNKLGIALRKLANDIQNVGKGFTPDPLGILLRTATNVGRGLFQASSQIVAFTARLRGARIPRDLGFSTLIANLGTIRAAAAQSSISWAKWLATLAGRAAYETANIGLIQTTRAVIGLSKLALRGVGALTSLALSGAKVAGLAVLRTVFSGVQASAASFISSLVKLPGQLLRLDSSVLRTAGNILTLGTAFRKTSSNAAIAERSMRQVARAGSRGAGAFQGFAFGLSSLGPGVAILASLGPRAAIGFGAVVGGIEAVKRAADFEKVNIAFETMLGNVDKARETIKSLEQFADITPFNTEEVIAAGKSLLAFGFQADQIPTVLQRVGDVASGLSLPFGDLVTLFGQFRAQSKIMTQDLRQLTSRGIPILDQLAKQFGVTTQQVFKMAEEGQIGFEHIDRAFQDLTANGGQFANLMQKQSQTIGGLFSTLSSYVVKAMRDIGTGLVEGLSLKEGVRGLIAATQYISTDIVPRMVDALRSINDVVRQYVQPAFEYVYQVAVNNLQPAYEAMKGIAVGIVDLGKFIYDGLRSQFNNVIQAFNLVFGNKTRQFFNSFSDSVASGFAVIEFAFSNMTDVIKLGISAIRVAIIDLQIQIEKLKTGFDFLPSSFKPENFIPGPLGDLARFLLRGREGNRGANVAGRAARIAELQQQRNAEAGNFAKESSKLADNFLRFFADKVLRNFNRAPALAGVPALAGLPNGPQAPQGPPPPPRVPGEDERRRRGRRDPAENGLQASIVGTSEALKALARGGEKQSEDRKQRAEQLRKQERANVELRAIRRALERNLEGNPQLLEASFD